MLLELSEILACPHCGPPQVMVAVVHEAAGHRVGRGFLGCPACDSRFAIEEGVVHLGASAAAEPVAPVPEQASMLLGAVLGLADGGGYLLLASELASIADAVAALSGRWEVIALDPDGPGGSTASVNVSRIVVPGGSVPPVLPGRCGAVALSGESTPERIRVFARAVGPLGRLAILDPAPEATAAMREAGLEVIASDARVAVASRRS